MTEELTKTVTDHVDYYEFVDAIVDALTEDKRDADH
jgi:hypothetical protein